MKGGRELEQRPADRIENKPEQQKTEKEPAGGNRSRETKPG